MKKHIVIVGLFLLLVFALNASSVQAAEEKKMSKKAAKLMTKAETAIREKQVELALDLVRQIIALEPENAKVRYYLGVLLQQKGMVDEAVSSIEETLRLQQDFPNAQMFLRKILFEAGREANSRQEYEKSNGYLIKMNDLPFSYPGKENENMLALARFYLGFNYFNLKQFPQAQAHFESCQALEGLETENLELYANTTYFLGMIHYIKDQFNDSIRHFKKFMELYVAMENKPQFYAHANYFIGANLFRILEAKVSRGDMGGVTEATAEIIPYFEKAVADHIPSEDPFVMLGNCYVYRNEVDKAIETYQMLIERFPQSAQLQNYKVFLDELKKNQPKEKAQKKR